MHSKSPRRLTTLLKTTRRERWSFWIRSSRCSTESPIRGVEQRSSERATTRPKTSQQARPASAYATGNRNRSRRRTRSRPVHGDRSEAEADAESDSDSDPDSESDPDPETESGRSDAAG